MKRKKPPVDALALFLASMLAAGSASGQTAPGPLAQAAPGASADLAKQLSNPVASLAGGGVEFMRPWTERLYGIPLEQVIGTTGGLTFEMRDGLPVLLKLPTLVLNDDKDGKPVGIQRHIGRRPIAAFGNPDGDLQMLQWTAAGAGQRFCLYVHHTDAEREWAYDRESHVGRLDKGLEEARTRGWTVVSMKDDWKTIFAQ